MTLTTPDAVTNEFESRISRIKFKECFSVAFAHMQNYDRTKEFWSGVKGRINKSSGEGVLVVLINPSPNANADFRNCHNVLLWNADASALEAHLRTEYALFIDQ